MSVTILAFPDDLKLAGRLAAELDAPLASVDWHRFPDGESLVALPPDLQDRTVAVVASLHDPDRLALPLWFAAHSAREFGACRVVLIAPYLAYMRQDRRFQPGQAISAPLFARFLDGAFDGLVSVDPHLHRIERLGAIYRMRTEHVAAAPAVAAWIGENVVDGVLIGPDGESAQWTADIAQRAGLPYQVLTKTRHGDRDVEVSLPDAAALVGRTPVIVDDIVSSGHTLLETVAHLKRLGAAAPVVVAIHPVFADDAYAALQAAGVARIVSTTTIVHPSNAIDLSAALADGVRRLIAPEAP